VTGAAARLACAGLACAGLIAGCGSHPARVAGAGPPLAAPLSTSLVTAQGRWAIAVMGGPDAGNKFWQLFFRPVTGGHWSLVTPQGVADNGGLVAAGGGAYLVVGFRPSQNLAIGTHPRAAARQHGRGGADGGGRGRRAVGAADHAQGPGRVRPGSRLRAGGRDRRLVRP